MTALSSAQLLAVVVVLWLVVAGLLVWRVVRPVGRVFAWAEAEVERHVAAALDGEGADRG